MFGWCVPGGCCVLAGSGTKWNAGSGTVVVLVVAAGYEIDTNRTVERWQDNEFNCVFSIRGNEVKHWSTCWCEDRDVGKRVLYLYDRALPAVGECEKVKGC